MAFLSILIAHVESTIYLLKDFSEGVLNTVAYYCLNDTTSL